MGGQGHVVEVDAWGSAVSCAGSGMLVALGLGIGCVMCAQEEQQVGIQVRKSSSSRSGQSEGSVGE